MQVSASGRFRSATIPRRASLFPERLDLPAILLLAGLVALALVVRFDDPLSSPVMATEDPYTHLVMTREHMERGYFADSFHMGTTLYPPGMHGALGIFWGISGVDLYTFMLLAAPFFGAFATAGAFLLAYRFGGTAAGATAGALTALIPEHVLRTNVFFPTALDLALVPFLLWALMEAAEAERERRVPWLVVAGALGAALTFAHPWVIPLVMAPVGIYLVLRALSSEAAERKIALRNAAVVIAVGAALVALALRTRWKQSGSGFGDFAESSRFELVWDAAAAVLNPWLAAVAVATLALAAAASRLRKPLVVRAILALGAAGALFVTVPVLATYPGPQVDYARQLGAVAIALGCLGVAAIPFWPQNRAALIGLSLALVAFPLTAVNVFQSAYLPHRTVAYLAIAVALLGGGLAALVERAVASARLKGFALKRALPPAALGAAVVVALAGAAFAPASARPEPWYRYYEEAEYEGFRDAAGLLSAQANAVVLSGDWRPNMMLKAFTPDLSRVWYSEEYFFEDGARHDWNKRAAENGYTLYVVLERYERERFGNAGWTSSGWTLALETGDGALQVWRAPGA